MKPAVQTGVRASNSKGDSTLRLQQHQRVPRLNSQPKFEHAKTTNTVTRFLHLGYLVSRTIAGGRFRSGGVQLFLQGKGSKPLFGYCFFDEGYT